jgi:uncharacterized protein (TIGR02246 family)
MGARMTVTSVEEKDAVEIKAALHGMQAAWNHHDMKAFVSYMTEDVEWVNVVGMWWRGKAQVFKAHDAMHKGMFKDRDLLDAETTELRRIAPGVVLVTQVIPTDGYTTPDGQVVPPNRNVLTEVFVHQDGRWLVAQGHNTVIEERAQAHDPGK